MKYVSDVVQTRLLSQNHCYSVGGGTLLKWVVMRCQIKILCLHISYIKKQKYIYIFLSLLPFFVASGHTERMPSTKTTNVHILNYRS